MKFLCAAFVFVVCISIGCNRPDADVQPKSEPVVDLNAKIDSAAQSLDSLPADELPPPPPSALPLFEPEKIVPIETLWYGGGGGSSRRNRCPTTPDCSNPRCDGRSCDDENPCTIDDKCTNNVCVGLITPNVACDDDNPCTTADQCNAQGNCTGQNVSNTCSGNNDCGTGTCLPSTCTITGAPCLTAAETAACMAQEGSCVRRCACPGDDDECTLDSCISGICTSVPLSVCGFCGDGIINGSETCEPGVLTCPGAQTCINCQCTSSQTCTDDTDCDDNLPGTIDTCDGTDCVNIDIDECALSSTCEDANPCTTDSCTNTVGSFTCTFQLNGTCSSDAQCTTTEVCDLITCMCVTQ